MSSWKAIVPILFSLLTVTGVDFVSCGEDSDKSECEKACSRMFDLCGEAVKNEYGNVRNCAADCEDDSDGDTGTPEELICIQAANSCSDAARC